MVHHYGYTDSVDSIVHEIGYSYELSVAKREAKRLARDNSAGAQIPAIRRDGESTWKFLINRRWR